MWSLPLSQVLSCDREAATKSLFFGCVYVCMCVHSCMCVGISTILYRTSELVAKDTTLRKVPEAAAAAKDALVQLCVKKEVRCV